MRLAVVVPLAHFFSGLKPGPIDSTTIAVTPISERPDEAQAAIIDPLRVRELFAQPEHLSDSAFLRREIAERMHERLLFVKAEPELVLDAGCGDGEDLERLQQRYPEARMLGVDISPGMLKLARARSGAEETDIVCGDFGHLPLADGSVGMLWSNLALHWHAHPQQVCAEWLRVLKLGGLLMFSCFGTATLQELRPAFAEADEYPHVLPFPDMHGLGNALLATGFPSPVLDREIITATYENIDRLFADVRAFGGNPLVQRRRGLFGRQAWARARQALDDRRNAEGKLSLSFEIIYGHAFRDEPVQKTRDEMPVNFVPRRLVPDDQI